jgi:hypothetical protein
VSSGGVPVEDEELIPVVKYTGCRSKEVRLTLLDNSFGMMSQMI